MSNQSSISDANPNPKQMQDAHVITPYSFSQQRDYDRNDTDDEECSEIIPRALPLPMSLPSPSSVVPKQQQQPQQRQQPHKDEEEDEPPPEPRKPLHLTNMDVCTHKHNADPTSGIPGSAVQLLRGESNTSHDPQVIHTEERTRMRVENLVSRIADLGLLCGDSHFCDSSPYEYSGQLEPGTDDSTRSEVGILLEKVKSLLLHIMIQMPMHVQTPSLQSSDEKNKMETHDANNDKCDLLLTLLETIVMRIHSTRAGQRQSHVSYRNTCTRIRDMNMDMDMDIPVGNAEDLLQKIQLENRQLRTILRDIGCASLLPQNNLINDDDESTYTYSSEASRSWVKRMNPRTCTQSNRAGMSVHQQVQIDGNFEHGQKDCKDDEEEGHRYQNDDDEHENVQNPSSSNLPVRVEQKFMEGIYPVEYPQQNTEERYTQGHGQFHFQQHHQQHAIQIETLTQENARLHSEMQVLEQQIQYEQSQSRSLQTNINSLQISKNELWSDLNFALEDRKECVLKLESDLTHTKREVTQLKHCIRCKDDEIKILTDTIQNLEGDLFKRVGQISSMEHLRTQDQASLNITKQSLQKMSKENQELKEDLKASKLNSDMYGSKMLGLQERVAKAENDLECHKRTVMDMEGEVNATKRLLDDARARATLFESEVQSARVKEVTMGDQMRKLVREKAQIGTMLNEAKARLNTTPTPTPTPNLIQSCTAEASKFATIPIEKGVIHYETTSVMNKNRTPSSKPGKMTVLKTLTPLRHRSAEYDDANLYHRQGEQNVQMATPGLKSGKALDVTFTKVDSSNKENVKPYAHAAKTQYESVVSRDNNATSLKSDKNSNVAQVDSLLDLLSQDDVPTLL